MELISGRQESVHDCLLIEEENQRILMGFDAHPRARTLLMDRWRLTIYDQVEWGELYDLEDDAHEMRNLWDDPGHMATKCHLLDAMARKMTDLADRAPFPIGRA
jgi:hypothetical protein